MKHPFLLATVTLLIISFILASPPSGLSTVHASSTDPTWQLSVTGLVNTPTTFTVADLQAMPQTTVNATLYCVDFPTTIGAQGNWTGVKLSTLLDQAGGVTAGAIKVAFYASDGYTTDLTLTAAQSANIIVAYSKDGAPLGEVLRLVVPDHWGYKWIADLVGIEVVDYNFKGKWESQGYSDEGLITQGTQPPSSSSSNSPSQGRQIILPSSPPASLQTSPSPPPTTTPNPPSQPPVTQPTNQTPQNYSLLEAVALIAIAIAATALFVVRKKRK